MCAMNANMKGLHPIMNLSKKCIEIYHVFCFVINFYRIHIHIIGNYVCQALGYYV